MTHTPLLFLLLLVSVYAKYSLEAAQVATHSDDVRVLLGTAVQPSYTELEALEQARHREVMANRAELRKLNSRLANVESKLPERLGQESGQHLHPDKDSNSQLFADNVLSTGEWSREISRSLFDTMIGNPSSYMKGTRIDPAIKDGKAIGFKLSVIRPGSLLSKLGFVNGDLLHALNGKEVELGPHHCGNLYGWLKQQSSLSFGITRNGKEEKIVISIVENDEFDVRCKNSHTNEDSNSQLFANNVRSTGEWSREISRSFLNTILTNPTIVMRGMRIESSMTHDKVTAFKLSSVRPGSLYSRIGFMNGDLLHSINAKEFELEPLICGGGEYAWLKQQSSLSFGITRNGKEETIVISIIESE